MSMFVQGKALIRSPASNLEEGLALKRPTSPVNIVRARAQWQAYADKLAGHGWDLILIDEAPHLADSVFIEDAAFLLTKREKLSDYPQLLLTELSAPSRRAETAGLKVSLARADLRVEIIDLQVRMDGGDVLRVGNTLYIGHSARTSLEAIECVRQLNAPNPVVTVPITKALHLKSACTALPDGTVIGYPPVLDDTSIFPNFFAVPESTGAHVVCLSEDTLLVHASAPESEKLLQQRGYKTISVNVSEFEKIDGCSAPLLKCLAPIPLDVGAQSPASAF